MKAGSSAGRSRQHLFIPLTLLLLLILLANDCGESRVGIGRRLAPGGSLPSPSLGRIAVLGTFGVSPAKWPKKPPTNYINGIL